MELNEYQDKALSTCLPSCYNDTYMLTLLCSEVGELQGAIGKMVRKEQVYVKDNALRNAVVDEDIRNANREKILGELGDILWAIAGASATLGFSLEEVAEYNNKKLAERKANNTIITHKDH